MDYFCFVEWDESQPGTMMPKLPDDVPFLLIAGSPDFSGWALFECDFPEDYEFMDEGIEPVSEELEILLYSAKTYPPAIALTRQDMEITCKKMKNISIEMFSELFTQLLKQHMQLQKYRPHFLAEAVVEEEEYLIKGAFYWITGFDHHSDEVEWVSDDYYIYQNPASDFGLEPARLRNLFIQ